MFHCGARAGKIGSQPAFPEGDRARVCGNADERKNRREKQRSRTSLYFWAGEVPRDERGEGLVGLMHPFA